MVYLSLGTNLGDREANLKQAIELLNVELVKVLRTSSLYETEPRDVPDQPWFLNMVLECETKLFPIQLMRKILKLEKKLGRDRSSKAIHGGPRLIDIDLLLYRSTVMKTPQLTLPHPRILERRFVLEPLLELAPDVKDPQTHQPLKRALAAVQNQKVSKRVFTSA